MTSLATRRKVATLVFGLVGFLAASAPPKASPAGPRSIDPAQVVPLDKIPPQHREAVVEMIRDHTMHRKGPADTFPCHSKVYLSLLNEPAITLALWQDLAASPVKLRQIDANQVSGDRRRRGHGDLGISLSLAQAPRPAQRPRLRQPPRGGPAQRADLAGGPSGFYREVNGEPWISARRRGVREGRLQGLEGPGEDRPAAPREGPGRPGPGGRLVRLADGSDGRELSQLGLLGRPQAGSDRPGDPPELPGPGRPGPDAQRPDRSPQLAENIPNDPIKRR